MSMSLHCILRCGIQSSLKSHPTTFLCTKTIKFSPLIINNVFARRYSDEKKTEIVYVGPVTNQIRRVKIFSLITSVTGIFAQPIIYERAQELGTSTPLLVGLVTFVGFFTFVTPLLLHLITRKYVTQIVFDPSANLYTATVYTLFVRKKDISFQPGEPVVPNVLGMFTTMTVRGTPLFIDATYFDDVNHYKKIMGYDKPIDLKLGTSDKSTAS